MLATYQKTLKKIPRFIPEYVLNQLTHHLHHLPDYLQNLVTVLLETGRRIGEICRMPLECLQQDDKGGYFLTVHETKLKRSYLLPVSDACIKAIKSQQELVKNSISNNKIYLFPSRTKLKTPHVSRRNVNGALNRLAVKENIVDENGNIWKFHSHQFRHTVGTRMINAGVSQTIVQRYLGHESAEMTARYAHIHDETLKNAFNEYQGKLIDIKGKVQYYKPQAKQDDANWLRYNTMSQALPNGLCGLPSPQQRCPHANACLTCVNFRTHKKHLPKTSIKKMNDAISKMDSEGLSISICSVATYAGVARSWIYNNPDLKAIIESYRKNNDKINRILDLRSQLDTRDKKIASLKSRNLSLKATIKKLRQQLEVVYGELYKVKN